LSRGNEDSEEAAVPHPRMTAALFGHAEAERTLLEAYQSGRIPHAWLIGGPSGIGKATLVYRMARFALAHPEASAPRVREARSLEVDLSHPAARQVAGQAHPDLLVLERTENENGVLRTVITVEQVARTVSFFGSTAGAGGWRVCIVDSADELNPAGANKLLKVLEEPPPRSLFLVVSHAPGRLLPTIRSRCRRLDLRPLDAAAVARAAAAATGQGPEDADIQAAAHSADGSVGRAVSLLGASLALRQAVTKLLGALPATDPRTLHALGDVLPANDAGALRTFAETVREWLSARLAGELGKPERAARIADAWSRVNRAMRDAEEYNLDRKPLVFAVFGCLAEAAR
jgi:DNA polymerase III subunit delta'